MDRRKKETAESSIDPRAVFPNPDLENMCYIKNVVRAPNVSIGEYTYYDDPADSTAFEENNILFNWPKFGDKLVIGKFCAIGAGTKFLMGSANHRMSSATTYPFSAFGGTWGKIVPPHMSQLPRKGDTVIGNDVWFGRECLVMPGARVGDGSVIAARSVVTGEIPPYTIAGGNPVRVIRNRFEPDFAEFLLKLRWWDLDPDRLSEVVPWLCNADLTAARRGLEALLEEWNMDSAVESAGKIL